MTLEQAQALEEQAAWLIAEGQYREAEFCCRRALEGCRTLGGAGSPDAANLQNQLAAILLALGWQEEALSLTSTPGAIRQRGGQAHVIRGVGHRMAARR